MDRNAKKICEQMDNGDTNLNELVRYYTNNYTMQQLTLTLATVTYELYKKEKEAPTPIPITREDFIKLKNLFKIKGYRVLPSGAIVAETRGGQRYDTEDED